MRKLQVELFIEQKEKIFKIIRELVEKEMWDGGSLEDT